MKDPIPKKDDYKVLASFCGAKAPTLDSSTSFST